MNKKVILVGPSKSLLISKLGKIIDSYDIVCRMNSGGKPEILNGDYKEIIGSKKDIWLCKHIGLLNMYVSDYKETVAFHQDGELNKEYFKILNEFNGFNNKLTCGMLSIFYLLEKYNEVHICGMDGFKGGHWYDNKFIENQDKSDELAAKGYGMHNVIKEQEYIDFLIQEGKIIKIDE